MKHTIAVTLFAAGLSVLSSSAFVVSQQEQALILQFGRPVRVEQAPGLKFKIPFVQNVEFYDNRLLDFNDAYSPIEVIASDQKRLIIDSFVRFRITDPLRFKQSIGDERNLNGRLKTILEASLRQVIGGVPLSEVISEKREDLMHQIRDLVNAQAQGGQITTASGNEEKRGFGIEVVDVRIQRADLPPANSEGIYKRKQTERTKEANQFRAQGAEDAQKIRSTADKQRTILLAEARKKAEILRGEGDGAATKIFADSFGQDQDFFQFYRSLQAYKKTLSQKDTTMVLSPDTEFLTDLGKNGIPATR